MPRNDLGAPVKRAVYHTAELILSFLKLPLSRHAFKIPKPIWPD